MAGGCWHSTLLSWVSCSRYHLSHSGWATHSDAVSWRCHGRKGIGRTPLKAAWIRPGELGAVIFRGQAGCLALRIRVWTERAGLTIGIPTNRGDSGLLNRR